jgi:hypothetical protein
MASAGRNPIDSGGLSRPTAEFLPQSRVDRDVNLTKALRGNRGVISVAHLRQLGFSRDGVTRLVSHGELRRLHRGVFVDGRSPLADGAYLKAALLAAGDGAWLAGRTAASVWGLRTLSLARIDVGIVATSTPRHRGLRVVRAERAPHGSELSGRRGFKVSSVPRLLVEVAPSADPEELDRLIEAAVRNGVLDLPDLERTLQRHARRPGVAKLKAALLAYRPAPTRKSSFERAFDRWLLAHPEVPEPERNVIFGGRWELDCYWPEYELALELDGRPYHITAQDFERDRLKDAWLQREGLRVLRVTGERWDQDRAGVHSDLMAFLGLGGYVPRGT